MKTISTQHLATPIKSLKKLNVYDNANYLLKTSSETFIFKTYTFDANDLDLAEAEGNKCT